MATSVTPGFIGRREALDQLETALTSVQGGAGRCVLVSGEAGIGKSRLIAEVRTRALGRGFITLTGRCFMQDRSFPYEPLTEVLRLVLAQEAEADWSAALGPQAAELVRLLPELAGEVSNYRGDSDGESRIEKRRLFDALNSFIFQRSKDKPLLLIVEDLHWSDQASLEYLLYLVRRIAAQPILLLLSVRDIYPPDLNALLGELDREPVARRIRLQPFNRPELTELLRAFLNQPEPPSVEFVEAIYRLTEGNPFFTEEICSALITRGDLYQEGRQWRRKPLAQIEIPDSLQRSVQQRLERVSPPARKLIDLAAVSGRSFDFIVLQTLTHQKEGELLALVKELMEARLVVEESAEVFSFRHALTREALYSRLLARERQGLHARMVAAIEQVHAANLDAHLEELAYHAFEAGLWDKTLAYAQNAGEKALSLSAPHAAAEQFNRVIQASGQLAQEPAGRLYRLRGQAFDTLGDFERAREDYEAALAAARVEGDDPLAWQTMIDLGLLWGSRDYERTGEYCRQALDLARSMEDPRATGYSLNRLGNWLMNRGNPEEALDYHQQALALFEQNEDQAGIAASLDLLAMASNQNGDAAGTVRYYRRAIPILRQLNQRKTLSSSLTNLSLYTLDEDQAREAVKLAREIDWRSGEAYALIYLGYLLAQRGNYGAGLQTAREGLALAQGIDHRLWQSWGHIILGLILYELQALEPAQRHLKDGGAIAREVGSDFMVTFATSYLVYAFAEEGRLVEVERLLPAQIPVTIQGAEFTWWLAWLRLALARQDRLMAKQLLEKMPAAPGENWPGGMAYFWSLLQSLRAENLALLSQAEEAEGVLTQALEHARSQGVQMGQWRLLLVLGGLRRAAADTQQADAAFASARSQIDALAATLKDIRLREDFQRKASALIPAAQPIPARQAASRQRYGGLTRRERQVAAVVVRGLSNQEIADELVVSVKTVEAHITRILSKLGFSSRSQIAAWAVDQGLAEAPKDLDSLMK